MSQAHIRWQQDGVSPGLKRLLAVGADLSAPLAEFGVYMIGSVDRNFREGGRRLGVPGAWPRLSPVTIKRRRKGQQANPRILQQTGILRRSTTWEVGPDRIAVGSNVPYAPDHHQDGRWGGFKLVDRVVWVRPHTRSRRGSKTVTVQGRKVSVSGVGPKRPHHVKGYAQHQRYRLPARPIYVFQPADFARLESIFVRHVRRATERKAV